MTRKILCSIGVGPHAELLELVRPTFESYASRHGYDTRLLTSYPDTGRPAPWAKVRLIQDLLGESYETVVWIDSDAVIVDGRRDIAADADGDVTLAATPLGRRLRANSGVMIVQNTRRSVGFLEEVWAHEQFIDDKLWENAAILDLIENHETKWGLVASITLPRAWNSTPIAPSWRPRIIHYAGYSHEYRVRRLRRAAAHPLLARRLHLVEAALDWLRRRGWRCS